MYFFVYLILFFVKVFFWSIIGYGFTGAIVDGSLFDPIRNKEIPLLSNLISCYRCTGAWVGLALSLFIYSPSSDLFSSVGFFWASLLDMMLMSAVVWIMYVIERKS